MFCAGEDVAGGGEHAFHVDGEGLFGLKEAWDFDEFGRLGGDLGVVGGGCAEVGWFGAVTALS